VRSVNRDDGRRLDAIEQVTAHTLAPCRIANEHQGRAAIDAGHLARLVEPDRTGREAALASRDDAATGQRGAEFSVQVRPDKIANGKRRRCALGALN
jgi:hypothetical protein